jgi:hypothetical protein
MNFRVFSHTCNDFIFFNSFQGLPTSLNEDISEPQKGSGFSDVEGQEIFEGDIIDLFYTDNLEFERKYGKKVPKDRWTFIVEFKHGCFGYKAYDKTQHNPDDWEFKCFYNNQENYDSSKELSKCKIVGNIFTYQSRPA